MKSGRQRFLDRADAAYKRLHARLYGTPNCLPGCPHHGKHPRGRVPLPVRRTGTEVIADRRTRRRRQRGQDERRALKEEEE
jgi:hypothetical protein